MKEWQFWTLTGIGGLALIVVIVNIMLFMQNRSLQLEVNNRQQFISQSVPLEQLNKDIITALANLSVKNNDEDLKQLLATHGITVSVTQSTAAEGGERSHTKGQK